MRRTSELSKKWRAFAQGVMEGARRSGLYSKASGHVCVDCGAPARHWEHRDYAHPILVEPTCIKCNLHRGPAKHPEFSPPEFPCDWLHWDSTFDPYGIKDEFVARRFLQTI